MLYCYTVNAYFQRYPDCFFAQCMLLEECMIRYKLVYNFWYAWLIFRVLSSGHVGFQHQFWFGTPTFPLINVCFLFIWVFCGLLYNWCFFVLVWCCSGGCLQYMLFFLHVLFPFIYGIMTSKPKVNLSNRLFVLIFFESKCRMSVFNENNKIPFSLKKLATIVDACK